MMKASAAKQLARTTFGLSLLVVIGAGLSSISSATNGAAEVGNKPANKYVEVVITPGESIWSIAAMVAVDRSIAAVVADIVESNNLTSADIAAGSKLLIPTK